MASKKGYTLLEYLVTIEMELKKLKKIVAESVGADYSELISQINGIGQELNSFKSSITDTVNTNNSEITSKFNSLEQQFNTFKTTISNTVNSNKTEITSQLSTLTTQFSQFKTTLESQVSGLTTRMTNVENRVTTLENNSGSGGSQSETIVEKPISNAILNLGTEKYQKCTMQDLTKINLPTVTSFTEIHLFFNTTEALTLVLPSCKWQNQPSIEANKTYEFIFTYVDEWLGGCIVYE